MSKQRAIIIGGGPAGLTAAYELLTRTDIEPIVLEQDDLVGGISRTVNHHGNRIDIGGHRFFSKSDRVMDWWLRMMPLERLTDGNAPAAHLMRSAALAGDRPDPATTDEVMLVRPRKSRIYYNRRFFDYPISLSASTIANLGLWRTGRIGMSYLAARAFPIRGEQNLEQFLINRFGRELYLTFFKSYTEKVWGVACDKISAEWGAQRIKGLSISKAVAHALGKVFSRGGAGKKGVETSLIEQFFYPKLGPGQMWETCARKVGELGGTILMRHRVEAIEVEGQRVVEVRARNLETDKVETFRADYVFSTMPIRDLVRAFATEVPSAVRQISDGLVYRDFLTVGLLMPELLIRDPGSAAKFPSDNWIYVQEPDVLVGRLQIFNNWSPWMVADRKSVWIGLEYFCNEGDRIWSLPDDEMTRLGIDELRRIRIMGDADVMDSTVIRIPKAYPAYFGTYDRFGELRCWLDGLPNLYLLGRNGMHRYNNQDHSMLTAMVAVDDILEGRTNHDRLWDLNAEQEYHEEKR